MALKLRQLSFEKYAKWTSVKALLILLLIYYLLNLFYFGVVNSRLTSIAISDDGTQYSEIALPLRGGKPPAGPFIRIRLFYLPWQSVNLVVMHRGCATDISINGESRPELISNGFLCQAGDNLGPVQPFLSPGINTIDIVFSNRIRGNKLVSVDDGVMKAFFDTIDRTLPHYLVEAAIMMAIMMRLRLQGWVIGMVLGSVFLNVLVFTHSDINQYAPDISGHKRYIVYLMENAYMPPPPNGMHRQHPPLYFTWEALAYQFGDLLSVNPWWTARLASHALYLGYVIFAVLFIEQFALPPMAKFGALTLALFIPDANMIAVRINNDLGFLFFSMPAIYFLQRWYTTLTPGYLAKSLVCAGAAVLCKATAFLVLAAIGATGLVVLMKRRITLRYALNIRIILPCVVVLACLGGYFGRLAYYKWVEGVKTNWFEDAAGPFRANLYNLFYFDIPNFIEIPISFGRTFLNYYFHTMLYGDQFVTGPWAMMTALNALWVAIFAICAFEIIGCLRNPERLSRYMVPLMLLAALILGHIFQRALSGDIHISAARYTHPSTVMFGMCVAIFMKERLERGHTFMYASVAILMAAFITISAALVVLKVT